MSVDYNTKIVTDRLILYLDAANNKSYSNNPNSWKDLIAGKESLISGAQFNQTSKALIFDGINDYGSINYEDSYNVSEYNLSYCAWAYSYVNSSSWQGIINKGREQGGASSAVSGIWKSPENTFTFRFGSAGINSTTPFDINKWYFLCLTLDKTQNKFFGYINGIKNLERSIPSISNTNSFFRIGCAIETSLSNIEFFNGEISNISIYQKTLSDKEVLENFNALRGRYGI